MGTGVAVIAGLASLPFEVLRRRMISNHRRYANPIDAIQTIYSKEGWRGFVGGAPVATFGVIVGSATVIYFDKYF